MERVWTQRFALFIWQVRPELAAATRALNSEIIVASVDSDRSFSAESNGKRIASDKVSALARGSQVARDVIAGLIRGSNS